MDVTREQLAHLINIKGAKITRNELWGALQRIPPAGEFATRMGAAPYAQALLLSILANRECESCRRGDNGGGHPCGCPAPCGARYCQHAVEAGSRDPWAPADDVVDAHICCEHATGPFITRASSELGVVDQIVALLDHRGQRVTRRVLRWVWDYLTDDDEPPF